MWELGMKSVWIKMSQVVSCVLGLGFASAQADPPRKVDVWFEANENSYLFHQFAARAGSKPVFAYANSLGVSCQLGDYLSGLTVPIEWRDAQGATQDFICPDHAIPRGARSPYCYFPGKQKLLLSLGAWTGLASDMDRLAFAIEASLTVCERSTARPPHVVQYVAQDVERGRAEGELLVYRKSDPSQALIHLPRTDLSQAAFVPDPGGVAGDYRLKYNSVEIGAGVAFAPADKQVGLNVSLTALGIKGKPLGSFDDSFVLAYHARGTYMGLDKPTFQLSLDASLSAGLPMPGLWVGVEAGRIKEWVAEDHLFRVGLGAPIFIKLGDKSFFLFEIAAGAGAWTLPKKGDHTTTLSGMSHMDLRLADFLVTVGGHADWEGGPTRYDFNAAVSYPLGYLLSNGALRLELSRLAVSGGEIAPGKVGNVEAEAVPDSGNSALSFSYGGRF
jgi:hypothetical protein